MVGLFDHEWLFCRKTTLKSKGIQLDDNSDSDAPPYSILNCVFCHSYTSNRDAFHVVWEVRIYQSRQYYVKYNDY